MNRRTPELLHVRRHRDDQHAVVLGGHAEVFAVGAVGEGVGGEDGDGLVVQQVRAVAPDAEFAGVVE